MEEREGKGKGVGWGGWREKREIGSDWRTLVLFLLIAFLFEFTYKEELKESEK